MYEWVTLNLPDIDSLRLYQRPMSVTCGSSDSIS